MSIQVLELLDSRAVSRKGGKLSATRSFHVWDDAGAAVNPESIATQMGTGGLPIFGEVFPSSPNLLARDYEYARVSGHADLWLVRWDYAEQSIGSGSQETQPGQPNYTEISCNITANRVPAWRSIIQTDMAYLVNSNGLGGYPNGTPSAAGAAANDIGGIEIDSAGNPVDDVVRQAELTITEVRSGIPNLGFTMAFLWRRNNNTFLGAPVGQLLYCGATVNRIDINLFQYQHKFVLDRWYHMRQFAVTDAFGDPLLASNQSAQTVHAAKVVFVQPFMQFANFFALSPNFTGVA
jgi:hypothetical protein